MTRKATTFLASIAVLVTALAAVTGTASAATYEKPEAACQPASILARQPVMYPAAQASSGSTITLYGSQWVAFQANLAQLIGGRWYTVQSGHWMKKEIANGGDSSVSFSDNWAFDLTTQTWGYGNTPFKITQHGVYAVFFNLYWYATGESVQTWADHQDLRTNVYDSRLYAACQY